MSDMRKFINILNEATVADHEAFKVQAANDPTLATPLKVRKVMQEAAAKITTKYNSSWNLSVYANKANYGWQVVARRSHLLSSACAASMFKDKIPTDITRPYERNQWLDANPAVKTLADKINIEFVTMVEQGLEQFTNVNLEDQGAHIVVQVTI